jgi:hypothetical protein
MAVKARYPKNGKRLVSVMVMVLPMNGVKARAVLVGGYWMMLVLKD